MARDLRARGLGVGKVTFATASFKGVLHHHGCVACHSRYTCACQIPETNGLCTDCRQKRDTYIMAGAHPIECCRVRRPATKTERKNYKLVGDTEWWFCTTCWRQFTEPGEEK